MMGKRELNLDMSVRNTSTNNKTNKQNLKVKGSGEYSNSNTILARKYGVV